MQFNLSKKCMAIAPSATLAITSRAKALKSQGIDVVSFGAGEPDFDTPEFICEAAREALAIGFTRYTDASGMPELKKAICNKLKRDNGLDYNPEDIVVSNGAKQSLFNSFQALLNPGDEVIIPAPYWLTYPELVRLADGVPVYVQTTQENGFEPDIADIEKAITPRTKAIIVNNPCNPTGAVWKTGLLKEIARLAVEKDFFIVSDEIYEKLSYTDQPPVSIASFGEEVKERTIVINGASKAFAMTGWRIGYSASAPQIAKAMSSLQSHATSGPNSIAQYACVTALNTVTDEVERLNPIFKARRDHIVERVQQIDGVSCVKPEGAFYLMVNISALYGKSYNGSKIASSVDFASLLLEACHVAVVPCTSFGTDDYIRLSYATSMEEIDKGIDRMAMFIAALS